MIPLYKNKSRLDVSNYRPISVLPVVSKVYEKVVLWQLKSHMENTKQYVENQFGFRKGSSTVHANQKFLSEILYSKENKAAKVLAMCLSNEILSQL